jgi:hypothetical protein
MCRFYSIRLWHSLLAVGPTGTLPVIPAMQFSTPEERKQNSNRLRLSLDPQGHRYGIKFRLRVRLSKVSRNASFRPHFARDDRVRG